MDKFILVEADGQTQMINARNIIRIINCHGDCSIIYLSDKSKITADVDFKKLDDLLKAECLL